YFILFLLLSLISFLLFFLFLSFLFFSSQLQSNLDLRPLAFTYLLLISSFAPKRPLSAASYGRQTSGQACSKRTPILEATPTDQVELLQGLTTPSQSLLSNLPSQL
ncbi:hypothetical protein TWF594_008618, partial [Orbilia oligospora]